MRAGRRADANVTTEAERKPGDNNRDDSLRQPRSTCSRASSANAEPSDVEPTRDMLTDPPTGYRQPPEEARRAAVATRSTTPAASARKPIPAPTSAAGAAVAESLWRRCNGGSASAQDRDVDPVRHLPTGDDGRSRLARASRSGRPVEGRHEGRRNAPVQEGDAHPLPAASGLGLRAAPAGARPRRSGAPRRAARRSSAFTLDNGLDVVVVPDHRAPVVTHMIWYRNGSADDPLGQSGIAHFLEHLMFKGTEKHPVGRVLEGRLGPRRPGERLHLLRLHRLFPARRPRAPRAP